MKYYLFLLCTCFLFACKAPQPKVVIDESKRSGTIKFKVDAQFSAASSMRQDAFDPSTYAMATFNEKYLKFEKTSKLPRREYELINLESGAKKRYLEMLGNKFVFPRKDSPQIEFNLMDDTKQILGMTCKHLQSKTEQAVFDLYYTEEIPVKFCPFGDFQGFTLEYSVSSPRGISSFKAIEFDQKKLSEEDILPKGDFQNMTDEQFGEYVKKRGTVVNFKKPAIDFTVQDLNQNEFTLFKSKAKHKILYFFGDNCNDCIKEYKELNALNKKYKSTELEIIGLSYNNKADTEKLIKKHNIEFNVVSEAIDVFDIYSVFNLYRVYVIDENNIVKSFRKFSERISKVSLQDYIEEELNK